MARLLLIVGGGIAAYKASELIRLARGNARELRAGVHVDEGPGEHADLADDVEAGGADPRQSHEQVDRPEGKQRHQPQRQQVEGAVAPHAFVDRGEQPAEARLHGIAQDVAGHQEGEQRAEARGEGHDEQPDPQPEHGARRQGEDQRPRNRQRRDGHVGGEEADERGARPAA